MGRDEASWRAHARTHAMNRRACGVRGERERERERGGAERALTVTVPPPAAVGWGRCRKDLPPPKLLWGGGGAERT